MNPKRGHQLLAAAPRAQEDDELAHLDSAHGIAVSDLR
jgi:hypothetical protein